MEEIASTTILVKVEPELHHKPDTRTPLPDPIVLGQFSLQQLRRNAKFVTITDSDGNGPPH
eukprot:1154543-Rhodomonas_salina.1